MAIDIYLNFNGNCREAVEFYTEVFEVEKQPIMSFGDAPSDPNFQLPEDAKKLVMHTFLIINDCKVMFSDVFPGMPFTRGNNISLTIVTKDKQRVELYYNKLKVGGTIEMELQETFWSKCYGSLIDKYGIPWQLSLES